MSQAERQELKQRVERAARTGPIEPYRGLRRFLLAIVIACPLCGATLLGIRRRRPSRDSSTPLSDGEDHSGKKAQ